MRTSALWNLPNFLALIIFALLSTSCSQQEKGFNSNEVSDYDFEFDEDKVESPSVGLPNRQAELELLDRAVRAYDSGSYSLAQKNFAELQQRFPMSYYATFAELKIADTYFERNEPEAAIVAYEEFLRVHPKHEAVPYVKFQIGNSHRIQYRGALNDQSPLHTAIRHYRELLRQHPASEYSLPIRRKINDCRELLAEHEIVVARFYHKQELFRSSAYRYRELIEEYADTKAAERASKEIEALFAADPQLLQVAKGASIPSTPLVELAQFTEGSRSTSPAFAEATLLARLPSRSLLVEVPSVVPGDSATNPADRAETPGRAQLARPAPSPATSGPAASRPLPADSAPPTPEKSFRTNTLFAPEAPAVVNLRPVSPEPQMFVRLSKQSLVKSKGVARPQASPADGSRGRIANPFVSRVRCEEISGKLSATVFLRDAEYLVDRRVVPVGGLLSPQSVGSSIELRLSSPQAQNSREMERTGIVDSRDNSCERDSLSVVVESGLDEARVRISTQASTSDDVRLLRLSRPNRLVAVLSAP